MQNKLYFRTGSSPRWVEHNLYDSDIYGGVTYTLDVNSDDDLQVGDVASARIEFECDIDSVEANVLTVGQDMNYYIKQADDSAWQYRGRFYVYSIERSSSRIKVVAYDAVKKLDQDVTERMGEIVWPATLHTIAYNICVECGIEFPSSSSAYTFTNSTFNVKENFATDGITGRQVMAYIAQLAGGIFWIPYLLGTNVNYGGRFTGFSTSSVTLDNTKYKKIEYADYVAPKISKVRVAVYDDDIGYTSGTGDVELAIIGNSAFNNDSTTALQTVVDNIYNVVSTYEYIPATIETYQDFNIKPGDIVTVTGLDKPVLIMSVKHDASGVTFESTGNATREVGAANTSVTMLNGKYNRLSRTLDSTISEVGQIGQSVTTLEQTTTSLTSRITSAEGQVNTITQTLDGVVFDDGSGTTVINGDNITTGTIQSGRLNLSGAITWGDCNADLQSRISASSVPSYIKETYIDATTIKSPTIEGNSIAVRGGTFDVKDATGVTTYGSMGHGTMYNSAGTLSDGIMLSAGDAYYLTEGDSYVSCDSTEVRLQGGDWALYVNDNGVYIKDSGAATPINISGGAYFL